jgi:hypothetical protein
MAQPDQALSVTLRTQWFFAKQKSIIPKPIQTTKSPRDGAARPGFVCDSGDAMVPCEAKIPKLPRKRKGFRRFNFLDSFSIAYNLHTCIGLENKTLGIARNRK